MPKAKTHKSMSKRVVITKSGIKHKPAAASHLRVNKSPRTTVTRTVSPSDAKKIKKMMPYG